MARWYFPNLVVNAMRDKDRVHVLKYEDVTSEPEREVARLYKFLSITPPSSEEWQTKRETERFVMPSWQHNPNGPIVSSPQKIQIHGYDASVFRTMRAKDYFFRYVQIEPRDLSPRDLAEAFGYTVELTKEEPRWLKFPTYRFARYVASSILNRRPIRPLWHKWARE